MTYVIEGEWSGYRSSQRRVVHREYTTRKQRAEAIEKLSYIQYTDGTTLNLSVRLLHGQVKREPLIYGYSSLIQKCLDHGVNSVAQLPRETP